MKHSKKTDLGTAVWLQQRDSKCSFVSKGSEKPFSKKKKLFNFVQLSIPHIHLNVENTFSPNISY